MGEDKVLAPGLADQPWVGAVVAEVAGDLAPEPLEGLGRAGEVDSRQAGVGDGGVEGAGTVAGHHVDDPGRQASLLEHFDDGAGRQH